MRKLLLICSALLLAMSAISTGCGEPEASPTPPAGAAPATKLAFTAQPSEAIAGMPFDPQPVVAAVDEQGNIDTSYNGLVVLTITGSTGQSDARIFGGTRVALIKGVVKFRGLYIDKAGSGYTLTATNGNLAQAISEPFDISPGASAKLAFITQPSGGTAGAPFTKQPKVAVQDDGGNTVTVYEGSVTIAITYGFAPSEAVLSGTTTVQVVNGIARFTDLTITKTNPEYKLTATSEGLFSAKSSAFKISAAAPAKLEFTVQPEGAKVGEPFETQPKVAVVDRYGNVVTSAIATVTLSLTPGAGTTGAILSGTKTLFTEDGLGGLTEFEDLSIDLAGSGYILTATADGLATAASETFNVEAP